MGPGVGVAKVAFRPPDRLIQKVRSSSEDSHTLEIEMNWNDESVDFWCVNFDAMTVNVWISLGVIALRN